MVGPPGRAASLLSTICSSTRPAQHPCSSQGTPSRALLLLPPSALLRRPLHRQLWPARARARPAPPSHVISRPALVTGERPGSLPPPDPIRFGVRSGRSCLPQWLDEGRDLTRSAPSPLPFPAQSPYPQPNVALPLRPLDVLAPICRSPAPIYRLRRQRRRRR